MTKTKHGPPVRTLVVPAAKGDSGGRRTGFNLDDVLRGVLIEWKEARGYSTNQAAHELGLRQQTLSSFLSEDEPRGCRLEFVSKVCAGMGITPIELFSRHEVFQEPDSQDASVMSHFREGLSEDGWRKAVEVVFAAHALGITEVVVEQSHSLVMALAESQRLKVDEVMPRKKSTG